jgi:hypothetical protein
MGKLASHDNLVTGPLPNFVGPLVTRERFAEMVFGSAELVGIVIGWCNKGLVPTVAIGKYSLINVELLRKQCLQKEFA